MIIYDPLYGRFPIPTYLSQLVFTPEIRRLSQVRLLNTLSPSLGTLGELRRYSHTLGVLYLCGKNQSRGFTEEEWKALAASVLLHDIGTPPFGHLFEYHLREDKGWSHEKIIKAILWGGHAPENIAHQIFGGRTIEFKAALKKSRISLDLVQEIISKKHPLSLLLFGSIDLDNIDNVARMAWALGITKGHSLATELAGALTVDKNFHLQLSKEKTKNLIQQWAALRRLVYEIIVFDPPTVAAQAVLSEAIGIALNKEFLSEEDWHLSDEELLGLLRANHLTKNSISREYLGRLPSQAFCVQIKGSPEDLNLPTRFTIKTLLEKALLKEFPGDRVLGYIFIDRGTFQKSLKFNDPKGPDFWEEGKNSNSIIIYGFVRSKQKLPGIRCKRALRYALETVNISPDQVMKSFMGEPLDSDYDQCTIDLTST